MQSNQCNASTQRLSHANRKLSSVITKKILKWLHEESVKNPESYAKFFQQFGQFIKEGVCTDAINKTDLAKLLRFNSSACDDGQESVSLDDYIGRMPENQSNIYFLQTSNRDTGLASPYYEAFKEKGIEVIFLSHPADHIVMTHLDMYKKHKLVSAESSNPGETEGTNNEKKEMEDLMKKELTQPQGTQLVEYLQRILNDKVLTVKISERLTSSPAIITDHEQASMQKFMKSHGIAGDAQEAPKYHLQVNPKHEIVRKLHTLACKQHDDKSEVLGRIIAEQVCWSCGVCGVLAFVWFIKCKCINSICLLFYNKACGFTANTHTPTHPHTHTPTGVRQRPHRRQPPGRPALDPQPHHAADDGGPRLHRRAGEAD